MNVVDKIKAVHDGLKRTKSIRDSIVIGMSEVTGTFPEEAAKRKEEIVSKNSIKNISPYVKSVSVREVTNGQDKYHVTDCYFELSNIRVEHRDFSVAQGEDKEELKFKEEKVHMVKEGDDGFFNFDSVDRTYTFNGNNHNIHEDVDLSDVNSIRYALRNEKEAAYFLDKFVIVTPEERESYRQYEEKKREAERREKRKEIERQEQQKTERKKLEAEQKKLEQQKLAVARKFGGHSVHE